MHPPLIRPFLSVLFLGLLFSVPVRAQQIMDYSGLKGLSNSMMPSLPGSMLGMGHSGNEGFSPMQDANVLFETVNDSLYIVGTGDYLSMGMGTRVVSLPVNPEGFVVLENIGPVKVGDTTLLAAKKILLEKIASNYKGGRVFVTLVRAKRVQASIVGAVQTPGIYVVSAAARITDILTQAAGFGLNANKVVKVTSVGDKIAYYDLDKYFLGHDLSQNPYVKAGDQILMEEVDYEKPIAHIRENDLVTTVQLKAGQSAYDVIMAYNSIRKHRSWNQINVFEGSGEVAELSIKAAKMFTPKNEQLLEVKSYKPLVFVSGAVSRPSSYDFNSNYNALDYIAAAGILPMTGQFRSVLVINADGKERFIDSSEDRVAPGDHIIVPESKESRMRDYINLAASIASIVASITLTIFTINRN